MNDIISLIFRSFQPHIWAGSLEGVSILCKVDSIGEISFEVLQGKLQPIMTAQNPDIEISGTLSQWMEQAYNPFAPKNGCHIRGSSELLQALKANIESGAQAHVYPLKKYLFARSLFHHMKKTVHFFTPDSPWATHNDIAALHKAITMLYQKLDRCEWALADLKGPQL